MLGVLIQNRSIWFLKINVLAKTYSYSKKTILEVTAHQSGKTCQEPLKEVFQLPPEGDQSYVGHDQSSYHLSPLTLHLK